MGGGVWTSAMGTESTSALCNDGAWCLHSLCLFPLTAEDAGGCGVIVLVSPSLPRVLWQRKEQHEVRGTWWLEWGWVRCRRECHGGGVACSMVPGHVRFWKHEGRLFRETEAWQLG